MSTFDGVLGAAQALAPPHRIRLIDALWGTVPQDKWPRPSEEWMAEVRRRSVELDAGRMTTAPWPDVRDRARHAAGLND
jgi:putative addiction module component (TIGR02574 family)